MAYYLDRGLELYRDHLKAKYPGIVIGWIGDPDHQGETSDHNPEADGSVDAIDPMIGPAFTHADCEREIDLLVASRDRRIAYIIWNGRIISSTISPWTWRTYTGSNKHTKHAHISINDKYENDLTPWEVGDVPFKDEKIPVTEIAGKELFEPDKGANAEVYAHVMVQTAAIHAQRASAKSTANASALAAIRAQNAQILANLAALAGKDFVDEKALSDLLWAKLPSTPVPALAGILRAGMTADDLAKLREALGTA